MTVNWEESFRVLVSYIGAITYGKERWFYEGNGKWYDRKTCERVTTQTAIEECLKAVRELDDSVIDAVPVRHGKWIDLNTRLCSYSPSNRYKCSVCGERSDNFKWCPNC